uniref:Uncharacterized protein n=1 Tax=Oryza glumipatula TaxID=40148 RepID=A0A0E0BN56_9ORYZ
MPAVHGGGTTGCGEEDQGSDAVGRGKEDQGGGAAGRGEDPRRGWRGSGPRRWPRRARRGGPRRQWQRRGSITGCGEEVYGGSLVGHGEEVDGGGGGVAGRGEEFHGGDGAFSLSRELPICHWGVTTDKNRRKLSNDVGQFRCLSHATSNPHPRLHTLDILPPSPAASGPRRPNGSPPAFASAEFPGSIPDSAQMPPRRRRRRSVAGIDQDDLLDPDALADPDSSFYEINGVRVHHKGEFSVSVGTWQLKAVGMLLRKEFLNQ